MEDGPCPIYAFCCPGQALDREERATWRVKSQSTKQSLRAGVLGEKRQEQGFRARRRCRGLGAGFQSVLCFSRPPDVQDHPGHPAPRQGCAPGWVPSAEAVTSLGGSSPFPVCSSPDWTDSQSRGGVRHRINRTKQVARLTAPREPCGGTDSRPACAP